MMKVISNTTPIITLVKVNRLDILEKLFGKIYIPKGVYDELVSNKSFESESKIIDKCSFIEILDIKNEFAVKLIEKNLGLDLGESEAIALYDELKGDMLIIDERKGRAVAKSMSINITGTMGLLLKAKEQGVIKEIKPLLDELIDANIRISGSLYRDILKRAEED